MGMAISNYVMARIPKITAKSISKAIEKTGKAEATYNE